MYEEGHLDNRHKDKEISFRTKCNLFSKKNFKDNKQQTIIRIACIQLK